MKNGNGDAASTIAPLGWVSNFHFRFIFFHVQLFFWKKQNEKMKSNHTKHKEPPNAARGINTAARLFFAPRMQQGVININPPAHASISQAITTKNRM